MAQPQPGQGNQYVTEESGFSLVLITTAIIAATLMQTLDTTIVNVALPTIQGNLGATIDEGAWVVTGYIISAVIIIPLTPWLQIRFGRRQYYSTAIIGFTVASVLCGLSGSIQQLILWRIVQGAFGGGLIAYSAQATLRETFPKRLFGLSQGLFSIGADRRPGGRPNDGRLADRQRLVELGVLLSTSVPGVFAGTVMLLRLKNPGDPRRIPLDGIGLALLILGLGSLQYVLGEGQQNDWFNDGTILTIGIISGLALLSFICWELFGTKNSSRRLARAALSASGRRFGAGVLDRLGPLRRHRDLSYAVHPRHFLGFTSDAQRRDDLRARRVHRRRRTAGRALSHQRARRHTPPVADRVHALVGISQFWFAQITTSNTEFSTMVVAEHHQRLRPLVTVHPDLDRDAERPQPANWSAKAAACQSLFTQLGGSISTAVLVTILARRSAFHQSTPAGAVHPARLRTDRPIPRRTRLDRPALRRRAKRGQRDVVRRLPVLARRARDRAATAGVRTAEEETPRRRRLVHISLE